MWGFPDLHDRRCSAPLPLAGTPTLTQTKDRRRGEHQVADQAQQDQRGRRASATRPSRASSRRTCVALARPSWPVTRKPLRRRSSSRQEARQGREQGCHPPEPGREPQVGDREAGQRSLSRSIFDSPSRFAGRASSFVGGGRMGVCRRVRHGDVGVSSCCRVCRGSQRRRPGRHAGFRVPWGGVSAESPSIVHADAGGGPRSGGRDGTMRTVGRGDFKGRADSAGGGCPRPAGEEDRRMPNMDIPSTPSPDLDAVRVTVPPRVAPVSVTTAVGRCAGGRWQAESAASDAPGCCSSTVSAARPRDRGNCSCRRPDASRRAERSRARSTGSARGSATVTSSTSRCATRSSRCGR